MILILIKDSSSTKIRSSSNYGFTELKHMIIEDRTPSQGFPPPPSPGTLHRSTTKTPSMIDPRLDMNFSSVIAQRAAASKARRHEQMNEFDQHCHGLPPATTFFNNCVTKTRHHRPLTTNGK
jgi:hypothetical protein